MEFHINKEALLQRFLRYVQIDSETGDEKAMGEVVEQDLLALGVEVERHDPPDWVGSNGFNLYGTLAGTEGEPLVFSSHMDTVTQGKGVKPRVCEDGYVRSDGTTILGGDDKAGIAAIMEALTALRKLPQHPPVEVLFTVREEVGLFGAKSFDYSKIQAKEGLVLDSGGKVEELTTIAPGQNKLTFTIQGKGAHAGIAPETGINAIQVAAHAVSEMELLRIDEETTANIGTFKGEGPTNIVCEKVTLILEVRSRNNDKLMAHSQKVEDCVRRACEKFSASYQLQSDTAYTAFSLTEDTPIVAKTLNILREFGLTPQCIGSGGGSDANVLNTKGIATANLAMGMEKVHTVEEQLEISQMNLASELCYRLMCGNREST